MHLINHRQPVKRHRQRGIIRFVVVLAILFVLLNLGVWVAYRGKALPRYQLGSVAVGGTSYDVLQQRLTAGTLLPNTIQLQAGDTTKRVSPADLGLKVNATASLDGLRHARLWLPALSLVTTHTQPLVLTVDASRLDSTLPTAVADFSRAASPSHLIFDGQKFVVVSPSDGVQVDTKPLKIALRTGVQTGKATITVPRHTLPAPAPTELSATLQTLQKQLAVPLKFTYNGKTTTPTRAQKGAWYVPAGQTMVVSPDLVSKYIDTLAAGAANRSDLGLAVRYAMAKLLSPSLAVVPAGRTVHAYCTASRNVASADFTDLIGKLALTYADTRGWNNGGQLAFAHVDNGCEYTVWLSAASDMAHFGSICDNYYNCQVGANVIVNDDRWEKGTDPWNATGGSIEDYRTLIINHETGHRLGFADNPICPGTGQPAPVMMQQSVDLKGCAFNLWPVQAELTHLTHSL
jgi:hypothetical protein